MKKSTIDLKAYYESFSLDCTLIAQFKEASSPHRTKIQTHHLILNQIEFSTKHKFSEFLILKPKPVFIATVKLSERNTTRASLNALAS